MKDQKNHQTPPTADRHWKSLEDLAGTDRFREIVDHEFPEGADQLLDPVSRRGFMKVMGASVALAGLSACVRQPDEKIIPYVKQPEQLVPGKPLFFATTTTFGGFGTGVVVESHEGRPTSVAGNPEHPASLGAVDVFSQAEILELYDPDRSQAIYHNGEIASWQAFTDDLTRRVSSVPGGNGVALLLSSQGSPTVRAQIDQFRANFPQATVYSYEPVPQVAGPEVPNYTIENADVIVALDAELFTGVPGSLRFSRQFGLRRDPEQNPENHNRLYVAEANPSPTGSIADHRVAVRSVDIARVAAAIAAGTGGGGVAGDLPENVAAFVAAVVDDLRSSNGRAVVAVGPTQPQAVQEIVRSINESIGAVGSTVEYVAAPYPVSDDPFADIRELVQAMKNGTVGTVIVAGSNPMYDAPADLGFAEAFEKVPLRIHHGLHRDETAWWCHWHIPATHQFEMWGDAIAFDGTRSIVQPLIAPLYESTKSLAQILAALNGSTVAKDYDLVRETWAGEYGADSEKMWRRGLHDGFVAGAVATGGTAATAAVDAPGVPGADESTDAPIATGRSDRSSSGLPADRGGIEVNIRPDPTIWDGRYNNNGWLQELPKPMTKLTWDNAVLMSPAMALQHDLENGDVVALEVDGRTIRGPIWITPGHADASVTVHLGYGRERTGRVGEKTGFNVYPIRTSTAPWFATGATMVSTGEEHDLVSTQDHWSLEGRNLYREATLEDFLANPGLVEEMEHIHTDDLSFYGSADWVYDGYAWGMTIDLNRCTACNACVIACQSENNIPVVGKDQVANGREMHWIRVDRYYGGDPTDTDSIAIYNQPVPCMQCEQAPCEVVCPVAATVHSAEGLNDMVYNRCVGTRYCSNNCPYKVRRFNFLQYVDEDTEQFKLMRNPDVSVRTRGVMEKCTYCVQRINEARIEAKISDVRIPANAIVTACQAACPTQAIAFGDKNNTESEVARLKASPRNYGMLRELNTRPRTTYLARLRNTHESLKPEEPVAGDGHH